MLNFRTSHIMNVALICICLVLLATLAAATLIHCPENANLEFSYPLGNQTGYCRDRIFDITSENCFQKTIMGSNIEPLEDAGPGNWLDYHRTFSPEGLYYNNVQWGFNQNQTLQIKFLSYIELVQEFEDWYNITADHDHSTHYHCGHGFSLAVISEPVSLPDCPDRCGNITIPYPFGTRTGCYRPGFHIKCNRSTTGPKAILGDTIQVLEINISTAEARINNHFYGHTTYASRGNNSVIIFDEDSLLMYVPTKQSEYYMRNKNTATASPYVLEWAIENGTCLASHVESSSSPACQSKHSRCYNTTNSLGYVCKCLEGYEGNPYMPNGCLDINESKLPEGTEDESTGTNRTKVSEKFPFLAGVAISSAFAATIFLGLCFLVATRRRHKRPIMEEYKLLLEGLLRVFSKREIEVATNNFNDSRVLGTGGQGKVYMGCLEDNKPAAIKIPKVTEEIQRAEFVNEIRLLAQLSHKNIVRLIGCCFEVKVPILVYEFVPNGTLQDLLHGTHRNTPIPLATRLKIALESAEALDYLHSSITQSILHGDFKSANILLADDYQAKVSDFGASNLIPIDDTHVVKDVQGTRGYIDPEYYATQVYAKSSDVYSFGVVLLELITRKYAIFRNQTSERTNLALCFVSSSRENELNDMLDRDIVTNHETVIRVLQELSKLAIWCVSAKGEDRPTMKQVVEKLQYLARLLQGSVTGLTHISEGPESSFSESMYYSTSDSFAFHNIGPSSAVLEIETLAS